jgi:ABC-2 type transport system ATP-binding protein
MRAEIEALLARMNLADRGDSPTGTLSGGMKRRLDLARALLTRPEVVLLDEPTLALDLDSRQSLWEYLLEANAAGATLLLATNDVYEAERYCNEVALIADGRLVARGTPADLKRDLRRNAVRIEWRDDAAARVPKLESMPGVGRVRLAGHTTHVTIDETSAFLSRIFRDDGEHIAGVQIEESTLEDVYFQLVGRGITHHAMEDAS